MKLLLTLLIAVLPCIAHPQAQAEDTTTVWRCGADGRSYSDTPCSGGRSIDLPAARSPADVAAAQAQAEQERRLAERLTRERQQRENLAPGSGLMGIKNPRVVELSPKALLKKKHKSRRHPHANPLEADGTWQATAQVSRRKKG
jgi:hypothetical protein